MGETVRDHVGDPVPGGPNSTKSPPSLRGDYGGDLGDANPQLSASGCVDAGQESRIQVQVQATDVMRGLIRDMLDSSHARRQECRFRREMHGKFGQVDSRTIL